jgi:hypothetical protein
MSTEPEILLNLWYVRDDEGIIYSLRARAYVGFGSDDEKLTLLRQYAETDYLIAQPYPIPERFHITVREDGVARRMAVAHVSQLEPAGTGIALFEDAIKDLERQMPAQTRLTVGPRPVVCMTPLIADDDGRIEPRITEIVRLDRRNQT